MKTKTAAKIADALAIISKLTETTVEEMVETLIGTAWSEEDASDILDAANE
jgi:ABC-type phosphate/phosphonate transport system substrate-binding protein